MAIVGLPVWAPTPDRVHALIPVRPLFTPTSRPSTAEVLDMVAMAVASIATEAPPEILDAYEGKVRFAVALNVASMVEDAFFPEQQDGPDAPGKNLYTRYVGELAGLRLLLKGAAAGLAQKRAYTIELYDPDAFGPCGWPMAAWPGT